MTSKKLLFRRFVLRKLRGRAFVTPCPPNTATLALVELLPFFAVIFGIDWRSSIDPDPLSFHAGSAASGTAEFVGVSRNFSPGGRNWGKSLQASNFLGCRGHYRLCESGYDIVDNFANGSRILNFT